MSGSIQAQFEYIDPMNFWKTLKKPIMVLAPMADVTDPAFRRIIAKYGKPDVVWTEFVSADGIFLAHEKGKAKLMRDLEYSETERPIVAQFFSSRPEMMEKAGKLAVDLGFDGLDINMGCPDRSIEGQGAGAALIKTPSLAKEVIVAAKQGVDGRIPVSVKTRIGYSRDETETWIPTLLAEDVAALTIHARTRKEMSLVPARWEHIARAVALRDEAQKDTLILGNGDAYDLVHGRQLVSETGADGVMFGRAIFGSPWLFGDSECFQDRDNKDVQNKIISVLIEHISLFDELLGEVKNFAIMKKHFKAYINGWDGAKELRGKLMDTSSAKEAVDILQAVTK